MVVRVAVGLMVGVVVGMGVGLVTGWGVEASAEMVADSDSAEVGTCSMASGFSIRLTLARPWEWLEMRPALRRIARCWETVDWARPRCSVSSTTRCSPPWR